VKLDGFFYMGWNFGFLFSLKVLAPFALLKYALKIYSRGGNYLIYPKITQKSQKSKKS
jgi:hypothetical protein